MNAFAQLYSALDETTGINAKVEAMAGYFARASPDEAGWAVFFLSGNRLKRTIPTSRLRQWASEAAGVPEWLLQECYTTVGDTAETITLLLPAVGNGSDRSLGYWVSERILPLARLPEEEQRAAVERVWSELDRNQLFVWHKLITGGLRVGVSRKLLVRGLSKAIGIDQATLMHRLSGHWQPGAAFYEGLRSEATGDADLSRPYPFCLAHQVEGEVEALGSPADWQIEWKWDGIRAQLIRRENETFIWSRGEDLITDGYPEVVAAATHLPDGTVLDGELLAWSDEVLSFSLLQRRLGRKRVGRAILREVPVAFQAFDLLEHGGEDVRALPTRERRERLERVVFEASTPSLIISPLLHVRNWDEARILREESRSRGVEGFMLKRRDGPYASGRPKGVWWKWKIDPFSIDAVLIYAQRGSGRRAGLYTDYTFAVRDGDALIPFAKAYSGLTDAEIREVDRFVRGATLERFGPVRSVRPELVFEIGFEGIWESPRHKSGIAVRFPRILRLRRDKKPEDAGTLEELRTLMRGIQR
jgi:DNA ligase 1